MGSGSKMEIKNISKTNNIFFDTNGYVLVRNIIDPELLRCELPDIRGQITYYGSIDNYKHIPVESQVNGSLSRYSYPPYKESHVILQKKIEEIVGKNLYRTYYYDRFYFSGQDLKKHTDRDSCEISISINIDTNLKDPWAFELTTLEGKNKKIFLNSGDGIIYKGCDVVHWREKMPGSKRDIFRKNKFYYHQVFFHYVLSDGYRCQYANDFV